MSNITTLIAALAERFHSENDLSDITYILIQLDKEFKKLFFETIFGKDLNVEDILYIQRELSENDSRPDFIIETTNEVKYLIEVKKGDKQHHFKQYKNAFPNYKRAYITNYELEQTDKEEYKNDYQFFTWKDIFDSIHKENEGKHNDIVCGYLRYLKTVCNFVEIKNMRFDNLSNLAQFNEFIIQLVNDKYGKLTLQPYDTKFNYSSNWSGTYFSIKKIDGEKCIYPWFGVTYSEERTYIHIAMEFDKGWCDLLEDKKESIIKQLTQETIKCECNNSGMYAYLSKEKYKEFQDTEDIDEQKTILKNFLITVINVLEGYL